MQKRPRPHIAHSRRISRLRRGTTTVEFALSASLFFTLMLGSVEFTRFMFARHAIDQAAYEACRFGIVPGNSNAATVTVARDWLTRSGITQASVTVSPAAIDSQTRQVTVSIQANFSQNSWVTPLFAKNVVLRSDVALDHENLAVLLQNP